MYTLGVQTKFNGNYNQPPSTTQTYQLSPVARYYICKLVRQISHAGSAEFLTFKSRLSFNQCDPLDEILQQRYPDEVELTQVILQLENLIHFYMTFNFQSSHYADSATQLIQVKQTILQLLGFKKPDA